MKRAAPCVFLLRSPHLGTPPCPAHHLSFNTNEKLNANYDRKLQFNQSINFTAHSTSETDSRSIRSQAAKKTAVFAPCSDALEMKPARVVPLQPPAAPQPWPRQQRTCFQRQQLLAASRLLARGAAVLCPMQRQRQRQLCRCPAPALGRQLRGGAPGRTGHISKSMLA
jgi:hypothetical protein